MPSTETDRIDWDDLRLCLAVARAGTLSAAGEALGISHSTLLRRVAALEHRLGATLFARSSNGYALNAAGTQLLEAAAAIEAQINEAVSTVRGNDHGMAGVIRFGVPDLSGQVLMDSVRSFAGVHTDIEIVFDVSQKVSGLTIGDCHLALVLTAAAPAGLVGNPIGVVGFAAYARLNRDSGASCDIDAEHAWIGLSPSQHHLPVSRFDDRLSQQFKRRHRCNSVAMQYAAIRNGLGLGVLACAVGDSDRRLIRCSPVFTDDTLYLWLLHRKELRGNARVTAFHRHLTQDLRQRRPLIQGEEPCHPPLALVAAG